MVYYIQQQQKQVMFFLKHDWVKTMNEEWHFGRNKKKAELKMQENY